MEKSYDALPPHRLSGGASYARPSDSLTQRVTLDSPARDVMTDFTSVFAEIIGPDITMEDANRIMIRRAIRLLLVVDEQRRIIGLLTATDILGERPMQYIQRRGGSRADILVRHVMTAHDALQVLMMGDVDRARVGHIVATLKRAGRQHALVAEEGASRQQSVRGIFSATQIARQLGTPFETLSGVPTTFTQMMFPT